MPEEIQHSKEVSPAERAIAEIEFEIRNWDQSRHISVSELAERIYCEFKGCGMPTIRAMSGDIS